MRAKDRPTEPTTAADGAVGGGGPGRRRFTWRRLVLAVVVLLGVGVGAGYFVVGKDEPVTADDGFVAFVPDASLFPAAPVVDAETVVGVGAPIGWPGFRRVCPYEDVELGGAGVVGSGWHTVRHDWVDDAGANAWVVSERTLGYGDLDSYDNDVQAFHNLVKYCGWLYERVFDGYNSIEIELDGLPDDALAFRVGLSPDGDYDDGFPRSRPEDFHAIGALIPGPRHGEMMNVMWVGWGADVPTDAFVDAVNTLYEAAVGTPDRGGGAGDEDDSVAFVGFDIESSGIVPLVGGSDGDMYGSGLISGDCDREFPDYRIWIGTADEDGEYRYAFGNEARRLTVGASRWSSLSDYRNAKDLALDSGAPTCIGSYQPPTLLIEPVDVRGLPDGTIVSRWKIDRGGYAAVVTDDSKQMLMTITWIEEDGPVPDDMFREVVNRAWGQFQADNP